MKLNPDCIRDILMAIESATDGYHPINPIEVCAKECTEYDLNEIAYHILQCNMESYFVDFKTYRGSSYSVKDLTPKAHAFLANIRNPNVWSQIKKKLSAVGSASLGIIASVAEGVTAALIKSSSGLE